MDEEKLKKMQGAGELPFLESSSLSFSTLLAPSVTHSARSKHLAPSFRAWSGNHVCWPDTRARIRFDLTLVALAVPITAIFGRSGPVNTLLFRVTVRPILSVASSSIEPYGHSHVQMSTRTRLTYINSGKGTPRRKTKKVHKSGGTDDKKLQTSLKKLNVQPIQAIEEVNMFKSDGNVIHFSAPKVHASIPANTFALYGNGEDKELTELVPGILNQLGPDSLASLRKLAESYQSMQKKDGDDKKDEDDDDIPDLVPGQDFEGGKGADVE